MQIGRGVGFRTNESEHVGLHERAQHGQRVWHVSGGGSETGGLHTPVPYISVYHIEIEERLHHPQAVAGIGECRQGLVKQRRLALERVVGQRPRQPEPYAGEQVGTPCGVDTRLGGAEDSGGAVEVAGRPYERSASHTGHGAVASLRGNALDYRHERIDGLGVEVPDLVDAVGPGKKVVDLRITGMPNLRSMPIAPAARRDQHHCHTRRHKAYRCPECFHAVKITIFPEITRHGERSVCVFQF